MLVEVLQFLGGLAVLLVGAELLVRGAAAGARRLGVPAIVVGMTVVAFGTSTPELVVSFYAAQEGSGAISFGNVVGSNIANVGLLLGVAALVRPLRVHPSLVTRDIPLLVLASATAIVLCADAALKTDGAFLDRADGLVLLLLFLAFLYMTALAARAADPFAAEAAATVPAMRPARAAGFVVLGLGGTVLGGRLCVEGAAALARAAGISEAVIGLTLVAVGTSVPELAVSTIAARRGQDDLAVGNIVGSNLFNLLFILGGAAALWPLALPAHALGDLLVMAAFAAVLLPLTMTQRLISRAEGGVLVLGYAAYLGWLALR